MKTMNTAYLCVTIALVVGICPSLLVAQSDKLPPEKQAIEQQYSQERAAGAQHPAPKNPAAPYPIAPGQPFPTGILDDCAAPFSSSEANIVNCWAGLLNGTKTVVYAGAEGKEGDPQQGVVYVVVIPGYPAEVSGGRVITPVKGGTVRIVAAHDAVLTLVSETGSYVLTFDLNTRTFTSAVVDTTPPVISGMPAQSCSLWPPDHTFVKVADVKATDALAGLAPNSFKVNGTSNEPSNPTDPDILITPDGSGGFVIQLRADRLGTGTGRIYSLTATASDEVGNVATVAATCTVPHDQDK